MRQAKGIGRLVLRVAFLGRFREFWVLRSVWGFRCGRLGFLEDRQWSGRTSLNLTSQRDQHSGPERSKGDTTPHRDLH